QVAGVVIAVTDALQCPNHLKANAIEQNCRADGRPAGKKNATGFVADDNHGALLRYVQIVQPAAFINWQVTNLVEVSRDPQQLAATLKVVAQRANIVARDHRRYELHIRTL